MYSAARALLVTWLSLALCCIEVRLHQVQARLDKMLLRLAQKMQNSFGSSDLLYRFGGEEFVVVLEPVSFAMEALALERFRAPVATSRLKPLHEEGSVGLF